MLHLPMGSAPRRAAPDRGAVVDALVVLKHPAPARRTRAQQVHVVLDARGHTSERRERLSGGAGGVEQSLPLDTRAHLVAQDYLNNVRVDDDLFGFLVKRAHQLFELLHALRQGLHDDVVAALIRLDVAR